MGDYVEIGSRLSRYFPPHFLSRALLSRIASSIGETIKVCLIQSDSNKMFSDHQRAVNPAATYKTYDVSDISKVFVIFHNPLLNDSSSYGIIAVPLGPVSLN